MTQKYQHCDLLYEDGANNMSRVIQLEDGSLFTLTNLSRQIRNTGPHTKHQFVFSRRSFDGGKTWTMPYPLFEIPETKAYVRAMPFMISKEGFLHVFMVRIKVYDFKSAEFEGDILHARMEDISGKNLKIQKIECLDRYTGALNNLIQLESGRLVIPFSTLKKGEQTFVSNTIYSDNEGTSWEVSNDISVISDETHIESGAVEPVIAEVEENKLVMIIRTVLGSFYYSVSYDGGATWSKAEKTKIKSSNAPAVLQKMKDGRILMSWNNCNGSPMRGVRYSMARQCLHAAVSDDGLKTLKGCRVIVKKEKGDPDNVLNCYPYVDASLNNEAIIRLMTVQSKEKEDWVEPSAKLIKLPLEFLEEDSIYDDFKDELNNWVTDYKQSEIINIDNEKALCVKSTNDSDGYAMINFPYGQKGKIKIQYQTDVEFTAAQLILSDNYIDQSSFVLDKDENQYMEYIKENYISIDLTGDEISRETLVIGKNHEGQLIINWDCDEGEIVINNKKIDIPSTFKGFNYAGIVVPSGLKQSFTIKKFIEHSDKAWLNTGIRYKGKSEEIE